MLEYEYIVIQDADPRDQILYRGSNEEQARTILAETKPVRGWGASLYKRLVGPLEKIADNR